MLVNGSTAIADRPAVLTSETACFESAAENSTAVAYRSAGTLASAVVIAFSTCRGTVSRTDDIAGARSTDLRASSACAVEAVKGGSPASISYNKQARL